MRKGLSGRLALDTSALIELILSTPIGLSLKEALKDGEVEVCTSELSIAELRYVLCRRLGLEESNARLDSLMASGYITVEDMAPLIPAASKYKCERAISLADCFCLALAHKSSCKATFAKREKELVMEMQKKPFDVEVFFLEEKPEH